MFQPRRPIVQPPPRSSSPAPVVDPLLVTPAPEVVPARNLNSQLTNVPVKSGGGITTEGKRKVELRKLDLLVEAIRWET
uniref:Uncharacterized protein n=1 Tax=Ditylenchus dipsaci TaxID=166011 RepID=A0A915DUV5_9BILA